VATNAGGACCLKYGVTADAVASLTAVLADGTVVRTGATTRKDVAGLDLTRLLVGSEGTLAVVVEVTVHLRGTPAPRPVRRRHRHVRTRRRREPAPDRRLRRHRPAQRRAAQEAFDGIVVAALALGGTLSGEHGVGLLKQPYLSHLGEAERALLHRVKAAFDPLGILNPGKAL
jgi:FAD/FMN-containing dehydrogenase